MIYLDTSIVVSLYCLDANSAAAVRLLQAVSDKLVITTLVEVEAVNAFGLREFRREITKEQAEASLQNFNKAVRAGVFHSLALPASAFDRARQLSRQLTPQLGTRTADLLHVAGRWSLAQPAFSALTYNRERWPRPSD